MHKQLCSLLFLDPLELYMYVNEESRPEQDNTSGTDSSL